MGPPTITKSDEPGVKSREQPLSMSRYDLKTKQIKTNPKHLVTTKKINTKITFSISTSYIEFILNAVSILLNVLCVLIVYNISLIPPSEGWK